HPAGRGPPGASGGAPADCTTPEGFSGPGRGGEYGAAGVSVGHRGPSPHPRGRHRGSPLRRTDALRREHETEVVLTRRRSRLDPRRGRGAGPAEPGQAPFPLPAAPPAPTHVPRPRP